MVFGNSSCSEQDSCLGGFEPRPPPVGDLAMALNAELLLQTGSVMPFLYQYARVHGRHGEMEHVTTILNERVLVEDWLTGRICTRNEEYNRIREMNLIADR